MYRSSQWRAPWDITVRPEQRHPLSTLVRLDPGQTRRIYILKNSVMRVRGDGSAWKAPLHQLTSVSLDIGAQTVRYPSSKPVKLF